MSRLTRILAWVGWHARTTKLVSLFLAAGLLVAGLVLGMSSASGSTTPRQLQPLEPAVKVVQPSRHYIVGTIAETLARGHLIVRGKSGRFIVVEYDSSTSVRRDRQNAPVQSLRRGTRVIILGSPQEGRLHADVVTITGFAPPRPLPAAASPTPSPSR